MCQKEEGQKRSQTENKEKFQKKEKTFTKATKIKDRKS